VHSILEQEALCKGRMCLLDVVCSRLQVPCGTTVNCYNSKPCSYAASIMLACITLTVDVWCFCQCFFFVSQALNKPQSSTPCSVDPRQAHLGLPLSSTSWASVRSNAFPSSVGSMTCKPDERSHAQVCSVCYSCCYCSLLAHCWLFAANCTCPKGANASGVKRIDCRFIEAAEHRSDLVCGW
jgi:hypothetical protein